MGKKKESEEEEQLDTGKTASMVQVKEQRRYALPTLIKLT